MDHLFSAAFIKIFLIIVLLSLIPALVIISYTGHENTENLNNEVLKEAANQLNMISLVQSSIETSARQTLSILSALLLSTDISPESQHCFLKEVLWRNADLTNIYLTDKNGNIVFSGHDNGNTNIIDYPQIKNALLGGGFSAGGYYYNENYNEPGFLFAAPLRDTKGEIYGSISVIYALKSYKEIAWNLNRTGKFNFMLIDSSGVIIYRSTADENDNTGIIFPGDKMLEMQEGSVYGSLNKKTCDERNLIYQKIRLQNYVEPYLYIIIGYNEKELIAPVEKSFVRNIYLMITAAAFSLFISALLGYNLIGKKLRKLSFAVNKIQSGDLSTRVYLKNTSREIKKVSHAINGMAQSLEERNNERDIYERNLNSALDEKNTLIKEIHHRVKNNLQMILSLINLEKNNYSNTISFSEKLESRINAMSSVYESLYFSESYTEIEIKPLIENIIAYINHMYPDIRVELELQYVRINLDLAASLALIINELIINCARHGKSPDGYSKTRISIETAQKSAKLYIRDQGPGFSESFTIDDIQSFGLLLVSNLTAQINGELSFSNDSGGLVVLSFPVNR